MSFRICEGNPGPGYWKRDNSHFPAPISRYLWELFMPPHHQGVIIGQARYGSVFDHFDFARFRGRIYAGGRLVDSPAELQKRSEVAERVWAVKLWRQDCEEWPEIRRSFRCRLIQCARQDPFGLNDSALFEHIQNLRQIFVEGTIQHFTQQPASMVPVGDWVRRTCEWTGASTSEVIGILRGCRSDSSDHLRAIDGLIQAIRSHPKATALLRDQSMHPSIRLERLRGVSPRIEELLSGYMAEYADRMTTGFDITDATLRELPGFTVSMICSRLTPPETERARPGSLRDAHAEIRQRVPAEKLSDFDDGLAEARAAYGLHDEDVRIIYLWPLGLLRRAVLVAADRLVARGALWIAEDVFQTTPEELDALMGGAVYPSAEEISERAQEWRAWANDELPPAFGERQPLPGDDVLGAACARISLAIVFYLAQMEECAAQTLQPPWSRIVQGLAASSGCYQGRARIVTGPTDFAKLSQGDILVARTTSPAYNVILPTVGAVVTDRGGTLCHAAIIAREFGIPAVVGAHWATAQIPDGAEILVDGDRGFVAVRV